MSLRLLFSAIGVLSLLAGTALWLGNRAAVAPMASPGDQPSPAAIFATAFERPGGERQSLARYQGKVLVVNFWATWCAPCLEEMPGFARLQQRWAGRNVQFVGLADDDDSKVRRFGAKLAINYPLWTGSAEVMALSRRLGNPSGVLPHTVILDGSGQVIDSRVGIYHEAELEKRLEAIVAKSS